LTAKGDKRDIADGLNAGADDYVIKPFDMDELRARIRVGERMLALQRNLAQKVSELQTALDEVQRLEGLLPICCYCKRIPDDGDPWKPANAYPPQHPAARSTHGICPDCMHDTVEPQLARLKTDRR